MVMIRIEGALVPRLVGQRPLNVIDDEDFDGSACGLELHAELLLHRSEDGRTMRIDLDTVNPYWLVCREAGRPRRKLVRCPRELVIEVASQPGRIDDTSLHNLRQQRRETRHRATACDAAKSHVRPALRPSTR